MTQLSSYLDELKLDADRATAAEEAFRREVASRTKELERQRAFAFRRLNLLRSIGEAIASAESEEIAVASAAAVLSARLGWSGDSDARAEVLSRFAPVAQAMFEQLAPDEAEGMPADVSKALAGFETWYAETHPVSFWMLFEYVMAETPVVDF